MAEWLLVAGWLLLAGELEAGVHALGRGKDVADHGEAGARGDLLRELDDALGEGHETLAVEEDLAAAGCGGHGAVELQEFQRLAEAESDIVALLGVGAGDGGQLAGLQGEGAVLVEHEGRGAGREAHLAEDFVGLVLDGADRGVAGHGAEDVVRTDGRSDTAVGPGADQVGRGAGDAGEDVGDGLADVAAADGVEDAAQDILGAGRSRKERSRAENSN